MTLHITRAFRPLDRTTATLSASAVSSNAAIIASGTANRSGHVRIVNSGAVLVFIRFGIDNTVTATTADIPLLATSKEIMCPPQEAQYIAVITASGTATVYVTAGEGSV